MIHNTEFYIASYMCCIYYMIYNFIFSYSYSIYLKQTMPLGFTLAEHFVIRSPNNLVSHKLSTYPSYITYITSVVLGGHFCCGGYHSYYSFRQDFLCNCFLPIMFNKIMITAGMCFSDA